MSMSNSLPTDIRIGVNRPHPLTVVVMVIAFQIFGVVLLAYAGLTPIGHWQDEFAILPLTMQGIKPALMRLVTWSPRPVSEALIYVYGHLVNHFRAPLIGSSLLFLWGLLGACMVAVPFAMRKHLPSGTSLVQCFAIACATYCLFLLGHPVSEMFYWPLAAFAYLPTLGAISVAMWAMVIIGTESRAGRWTCAIALIVAAWSAEVGAMLVFVFCGLTIGYAVVARLAKRDFGMPRPVDCWIAAPLLASAAVLVILRLVRVGNPNEIFGDSKIAHHLGPALELAVYHFIDEVVAPIAIVESLDARLMAGATKLAFVLGIYGILRPIFAKVNLGRAVPLLLVFGIACVATVFLTTAAAYYEFGLVCCERHETFRLSLIYVGLASVAAFAASIRMRVKTAAPYGAPWYVALLAAAVLIQAYGAAPAVISDYQKFDEYFRIKNANWAAGTSPAESMVFLQKERGQVIGGLVQPEATHTFTSNSGWWIESILTFFGKKSLTFQTEK